MLSPRIAVPLLPDRGKMKFDPQIHHRRTIRLRHFDYAQPGSYFITIVTHQRECIFGGIANGIMKLNGLGAIAKHQWEKLPKRFPNIELGAFVIMPNHIHGIIEIVDESRRGTAEDCDNHVEPSYRRSPTIEKFQKLIKGSIPAVVRSYKSTVTSRINSLHKTHGSPVWQRNYGACPELAKGVRHSRPG